MATPWKRLPSIPWPPRPLASSGCVRCLVPRISARAFPPKSPRLEGPASLPSTRRFCRTESARRTARGDHVVEIPRDGRGQGLERAFAIVRTECRTWLSAPGGLLALPSRFLRSWRIEPSAGSMALDGPSRYAAPRRPAHTRCELWLGPRAATSVPFRCRRPRQPGPSRLGRPSTPVVPRKPTPPN